MTEYRQGRKIRTDGQGSELDYRKRPMSPREKQERRQARETYRNAVREINRNFRREDSALREKMDELTRKIDEAEEPEVWKPLIAERVKAESRWRTLEVEADDKRDEALFTMRDILSKCSRPVWEEFLTEEQFYSLPAWGRILAEWMAEWQPFTMGKMADKGTLFQSLREDGTKMAELEQLNYRTLGPDGAAEIVRSMYMDPETAEL